MLSFEEEEGGIDMTSAQVIDALQDTVTVSSTWSVWHGNIMEISTGLVKMECLL